MIKLDVQKSTVIHSDKSQHLGIDIQYLIGLTEQKSFRMPSGLTREERRAWAKKNQKTHNQR